LYEAASMFEISIVGGDTVSATEFSLSLSAIGHAASKPLLRSSARAGDGVWLTGVIGSSGLGLGIIKGDLLASLDPEGRLVSSHYRPIPRLKVGQLLGQRELAHAMIDISDGLLQDAQHVAKASGVTIKIDLAAIPIDAVASSQGLDLSHSLMAGEDYELLFTASSDKEAELLAIGEEIKGETSAEGVVIKRIGEVLESRGGVGEVLVFSNECDEKTISEWLNSSGAPAGFDHFNR
jgi:thiamine-monophosphate kinase